MERIKDKVGVEKVPEEMPKGKKDDGLDMDAWKLLKQLFNK